MKGNQHLKRVLCCAHLCWLPIKTNVWCQLLSAAAFFFFFFFAFLCWIFKINSACETFHSTVMDEEAAGPWYRRTGGQCGFTYAVHYLFESDIMELFDKLSCEWWRNLSCQAGWWKITCLFFRKKIKTGMIVMIRLHQRENINEQIQKKDEC